MKPTTQVYQAALKMQSPEMQPLLEWIEQERAETLELLSTSQPEVLQKMQGQAQMAQRILEVVRTSRDVLEKLGA